MDIDFQNYLNMIFGFLILACLQLFAFEYWLGLIIFLIFKVIDLIVFSVNRKQKRRFKYSCYDLICYEIGFYGLMIISTNFIKQRLNFLYFVIVVSIIIIIVLMIYKIRKNKERENEKYYRQFFQLDIR